MTKTNESGLIGIQYLRAVLVFLVVIDHAGILISLEKYFGRDVIPSYINYFGVVGVNIFFVISGFIIVYTSTSNESFRVKVSLQEFLKKRALRLLPIMWLSVLAYALLKRLGRGEWGDVEQYITAFFLYPFADINPTQLWTLRHEVYFYLVFGFSFFLKNNWIFFILAWAVMPFFLFKNDDLMLNFFFSPFNYLFGVGVVWSLLFKRFGSVFEGHPKKWFFLMFFGTFLTAFICNSIEYSHKSLYSIFIFGVMAFLIVGISVKTGMKIPGVFGRVLKVCGDASYSIYLFHGIFLSAIVGWLSKFKNSMNVYVVFPSVILLAMVLGVLVFYYVEKRLVMFVKSKFMI